MFKCVYLIRLVNLNINFEDILMETIPIIHFQTYKVLILYYKKTFIISSVWLLHYNQEIEIVELWFSLDICPEMGLQDHMVAPFLVF